ncbi:MAG: hypothetical protein QNJ98_09250 [Planctomycetota bacterium]|nr:hypothetical protein [Planctomycetota bacterium]
MRLTTLALILSSILVLPACGGGGSGGPATAELRIYGATPVAGGELTAGHVAAGLTHPFLLTGVMDRGNPLGMKGLLRFRLEIPAGAEIVEATVELSQNEVVGSPFTRFGDILLNHVRYGATVTEAGYHASPLSSQVLSNDPALGPRIVQVRDQVLSELARGATTIDFQVAFPAIAVASGTDFVRLGDFSAGITDGTPWLRIVYRMP